MKYSIKKLAVFAACLFTGASALVISGCDIQAGGEEVTNVDGLTAKSIKITTLPTKLVYNVGETLDTTGIKVTATFTNGKKGDVTSLVSYSNVDMSTEGKKSVAVVYQTASDFFEITVQAASHNESGNNGGENNQGGNNGGESGNNGGENGNNQGGEEVQYTESASFPAAALQSFLTSQNLTTTVPTPNVNATPWYYASGVDDSGNAIFEAYTLDSGTPGTNAIEDSYKTQLAAAGWTIDDTYYDLAGYYANKDDVEILFYTYDGEFVMDVYAASASSASFEESATFPATQLQSFLTSESLTTAVPSPVGGSTWYYAVQEDEDGKYFSTYTEDNGTPGTNAIEDTYKALLLTAGWTIDDSEYEDYGYFADKGDVEIQFYSDSGQFCMWAYAADGNGGTGGDPTPVTPSTPNDGLTVDTAFTAAEACAFARSQEDGVYSTSCYYVKDVVTSVASGFDASYGTLTFNLGEFVAFRLKNGANHEKFTTGNEIKVGDTVIIYGQIVNYVSGDTKTPEMTYSYNNNHEGYVYAINPSGNGGNGGNGGNATQPDPKEKADWTIMIYMCGSDLESENGFASSDIDEILSVPNQPDDVNIIIETGGATSWTNSKISANELGRWHVENRQLVKDDQLTNASMAEEATFESFLNWGLTYYPADKTGVILWNHGGALDGCCFDENYSDLGSSYDYLTNSETKTAFANVLGSTKLEFVGYDCCLMQVQDVADFNSNYFNYMIAAEESEAGEGWAYNSWVDDLYAKKSTETILTAACDGFLAAYEQKYPQYDNDQTLSVLDLTKMADYRLAFEAMAASLANSIKDSKFNTLLKTVKCYGDSWLTSSQYQQYLASGYTADMFSYQEGYYVLPGYYDYASFDAKDLLTKLSTNTTLGLTSAQKTNVQNALTALNNLIVYNAAGDEAGNSNGLALICPAADWWAEYYLASETNFVTWRNAVTASARNY